METYHHIRNKIRTVESTHPSCWAEKIHGANVRFHHLHGKITFGSRNQVLSEDDTFYNFQEILDQLKPMLLKLGEILPEFTLYGELFGAKVQKEIFYSSSVHFLAFDLVTEGKYLSVARFIELCDQFQIPRVQFHFGTWAECMEVPIEGVDSPWSVAHGEATDRSREWEGIVIKSVHESEFSKPRRILKRKTQKFSERLGTKTVKVFSVDPVVKQIQEQLPAFLSDARLTNLRSHGGLDSAPIHKLAGLLLHDAMEEYLDENPTEITPKQQKLIKSSLMQLAIQVVEENLK